MDLQDWQDDRPADLWVREITGNISGCPYEVISELGTGKPELEYKQFTQHK
ncbi:MAG: hypothetical protein KF752_19175 [Pirellulaceae bacterium]|nr:hypothetical protein [Pirellulaceae bacterium]